MARQNVNTVTTFGNEARIDDNFIELYTTVATNTANLASASAAIASINAVASAFGTSLTSANAAIASVNTIALAASAAAAAASANITTLQNQRGLVKLTTVTADNTSAALSITSGINSTYRAYLFEVEHAIPATANIAYSFQVSTDAGSAWQATGYQSALWLSVANNTNANLNLTTGAVTTSAVPTTTATGGLSGSFLLHNPSNTASYKPIDCKFSYWSGGTLLLNTTGTIAWASAASAITGARLLCSTGNITSGTMTMYGLL